MNTTKLSFMLNGNIHHLHDVKPTRTLLELLREDLAHTSSKEGCGEGDCGACTVVTGELQQDNTLSYKAINACIRLAHSIDGMAIWTASGIKDKEGNLHPVQQAMVDNHGSQCGFCTPGFVMSLFALYQNKVCHENPVTVEDAKNAISGNLCRCTGYRPIVDAALSLAKYPKSTIDEKHIIETLKPLQRKHDLKTFLQIRAEHPEAQIVAGCTDVGLWITKMHQDFPAILDTTKVPELLQYSEDQNTMHIGAGVSLQQAFELLVEKRPVLQHFVERFAGLPIRNSGTLGGNLANGSPIGDSMPLLIALGTSITLEHWDGKAIQSRSLPLEDFYLDYRKNVLQAQEVLTKIHIPLPKKTEFLRAYKVSKRFEDDISAVCLCIQIHLDSEQVVQDIRIGAGGVAAIPARARETENICIGKPWGETLVQAAQQSLTDSFSPISDMRASKEYRQVVLHKLLQRFWLESQGMQQLSLEDCQLKPVLESTL
jgi:xanthine dehydrogenase small subunit